MAHPKSFKLILAPNIKNDYLVILEKFIKFIEAKSSSEHLHEYVTTIRDKVELDHTGCISFTHKDYEFHYNNYGKSDKADSLQATNKKKFTYIRNHLDDFNSSVLKNSKYQLVLSNIYIDLTVKEIEETSNNSTPDKGRNIWDKIYSEGFIISILLIVRDIFISPKNLKKYHMHKIYWLIMALITLFLVDFLLFDFVKANLLSLMEKLINFAVLKYGMSPKLQYIIEEKRNFENLNFGINEYGKSLFIFALHTFVFYYIILKLFKSKIYFSQIMLVNAITIGTILIILQYIMFGVLPYVNVSFRIVTIVIMISSGLFFILNARPLYQLSEIKLGKFILAYGLINLILGIFGIIMIILFLIRHSQ